MKKTFISTAVAGAVVAAFSFGASDCLATSVTFQTLGGAGSATGDVLPLTLGSTFTGTLDFNMPVNNLQVSTSDQGTQTMTVGNGLLGNVDGQIHFTLGVADNGFFDLTDGDGTTFHGTVVPGAVLTGGVISNDYSVTGLSIAASLLPDQYFGTMDLGGFKSQLPLLGSLATASFTLNPGTQTFEEAQVTLRYTFQGSSFSPLPASAWAGITTLVGMGLVGLVYRRRQLAC